MGVRVQLSCMGEHVVATEWGWQDGVQKPGTHTCSASEWSAQQHSASEQQPRYPIQSMVIKPAAKSSMVHATIGVKLVSSVCAVARGHAGIHDPYL